MSRSRAHIPCTNYRYLLPHQSYPFSSLSLEIIELLRSSLAATTLSPTASVPCGERLHVFNHSRRKLARLRFRGSSHRPLEVIRHKLLRNRLLHRTLDQSRRLIPAQEVEQHNAREDHRSGIDHILVRILRSSSMGRLKDCVTVANIPARRNPQAANLCRGSVRDVIAIQVRLCQNTVVFWAQNDLLKDRVGDAIVDQHLLFPLAAAVRFAN